MAQVTVRYYAGAAAAAGCTDETRDADTIAALIVSIERDHDARLKRVLAIASFLVDGTIASDRTAPLTSGSTVDVLPPFAGG